MKKNTEMQLSDYVTEMPSEQSPAEAVPTPEPEETSADGVVVISPLYKPIVVDGKQITELRMDLGGLSEPDLVNIDAEMRQAKDPSSRHTAFSSSYCMRIAARACGLNYREMARLSAKDCMKVMNAVQDFFLT